MKESQTMIYVHLGHYTKVGREGLAEVKLFRIFENLEILES